MLANYTIPMAGTYGFFEGASLNEPPEEHSFIAHLKSWMMPFRRLFRTDEEAVNPTVAALAVEFPAVFFVKKKHTDFVFVVA